MAHNFIVQYFYMRYATASAEGFIVLCFILPNIDVLCLGIDDLHNFVSVALHTTAGEDPYDSDRLSNLKKVGNAFGPLIFDLNKDKTFETFRKGCIAVWDAMESSSEDLPEKLVKTM